jgi:hypothetical protein
MTLEPRATRQDYELAFNRLEFPLSKDAILIHAADHGGLDSEVNAMLAQLPDERYDSLDELHEALRAVYAAQGVAPEAIPV